MPHPGRHDDASLPLDRLGAHVLYLDLHEQPQRWYIKAIAQTWIDPDVFTPLLEDLNRQQPVRMDYEKPGQAATRRKIDPLCQAVIDRAVLITA